jgi:hypothetical protein
MSPTINATRSKAMKIDVLNPVLRSFTLAPIGLVLIISCSVAPSSTREPTPYGYIVLGPIAKKGFNITGGDTLPELHRQDVPRSVSERTASEASQAHYDGRCTRFFHAPTAIVAVLSVNCGRDADQEDGERLMAVDGNGALVGKVFPVLSQNHYSAIYPARRIP